MKSFSTTRRSAGPKFWALPTLRACLSLLLAALLLAGLALPALGAGGDPVGTIVIENPDPSIQYRAYRIFDAELEDGEVAYTLSTASPFLGLLLWTSPPVEGTEEWDVYEARRGDDPDATALSPVSKIEGLRFLPTANPPAEYAVQKLAAFHPSDFAKEELLEAIRSTSALQAPAGYFRDAAYTDGNLEIAIDQPGYYLVLRGDGTGFGSAGDAPMLTTVLPGQRVRIQDKNSLAFDKRVEKYSSKTTQDRFLDDFLNISLGKGTDVDGEFLPVDSHLLYRIEARIPEYSPYNPLEYFYIQDAMTPELIFLNQVRIDLEGVNGDPNDKQSFWLAYDPDGEALTVHQYDQAGSVSGDAWPPATGVTWELVTNPAATLTGNQVRIGQNGKTFEISFDVNGRPDYFTPGTKITVTYLAKVSYQALGEVLVNRAAEVYSYGDGPISLDDKTVNYCSKIIVDKFAAGNRSQKLAGAEFVVYLQALGGAGNAEENRYYYSLQASQPTARWYADWGTALGAVGSGGQAAGAELTLPPLILRYSYNAQEQKMLHNVHLFPDQFAEFEQSLRDYKGYYLSGEYRETFLPLYYDPSGGGQPEDPPEEPTLTLAEVAQDLVENNLPAQLTALLLDTGYYSPVDIVDFVDGFVDIFRDGDTLVYFLQDVFEGGVIDSSDVLCDELIVTALNNTELERYLNQNIEDGIFIFDGSAGFEEFYLQLFGQLAEEWYERLAAAAAAASGQRTPYGLSTLSSRTGTASRSQAALLSGTQNDADLVPYTGMALFQKMLEADAQAKAEQQPSRAVLACEEGSDGKEVFVFQNPVVIDGILYAQIDGMLIPAQASDGTPYFETIEVKWIQSDSPETDQWITHVVTDENGMALLGYLDNSENIINGFGNGVQFDGIYYLLETDAPVDYAREPEPYRIWIDASPVTGGSSTASQDEQYVTYPENVPNRPKSSMPTTGGPGAAGLAGLGAALCLIAALALGRRKAED